MPKKELSLKTKEFNLKKSHLGGHITDQTAHTGSRTITIQLYVHDSQYNEVYSSAHKFGCKNLCLKVHYHTWAQSIQLYLTQFNTD